MPFYHKLGIIPRKRHVVFRNPEGGLYQEELVGTQGFSGMSALAYHLHAPTQIRAIESPYPVQPKIAIENNINPLKFEGFAVPPVDDYIDSRRVLFLNSDMAIGLAAPTATSAYFFKNTDSDEIIFVHKGRGELQTMFGMVPFEPGDYLVIPRGTIYRFEMAEGSTPQRHLVLETPGHFSIPKDFRNQYGQLLEHAPYYHRDLRRPSEVEYHDEQGEFELHVRINDGFQVYELDHHPFDVVGWDGFVYPWAFNIRDFEPITGRVHQPPPVHQTFEAEGYVICSFVPRLFDYHPEAIPAPYNHANVNSDEVLYYWDGDFMSRKGVGQFDITLHPSGMPHGPHPGTTEASIGKPATAETAVMMDTFRPLHVAKAALALENPDYMYSWLPAEPGGSTADGGKHGTGGAADAAR